MFMTAFLFFAILSLLVLGHEFGHFWTARKLGVKVEEFGFGFPPRLFHWTYRGTVYSFNLIPLGGFVRVKGESGDSQDPDSFGVQAKWKRFCILIAGVVMNVILAMGLLGVGYLVGLPAVLSDHTPARAVIEDRAIQIAYVLPESSAADAKLETGDRVVSVDDRVFDTATAMRAYLGEQTGEVHLLVERQGVHVEETLVRREVSGVEGAVLGVELVETGLVSYPFFDAIWHGVVSALDLTWQVASAFASILSRLMHGTPTGVELSGPVGIAVMTGEVARMGVGYVLQFAALLSVNLAILNVLPIPALDGGRILFVFLEWVTRGRSLRHVEAWAHRIGFLALLLVVVLVTYQDLVRVGGSLMTTLTSFFSS